ncbi:MAG: hypothetical protein R2752_13005 [Vicinamibacterales bacterium]
MFRRIATAIGALLILFHVWLLGSQLWDGQLADPALVVRWVIGLGLVAGLVAVRRQGGSMFFGRRAVSIWLLAVLLHGPAVARDFGAPALPEVVATLAEVALVAAAAAGLALALALVASRRSWRPSARVLRRRTPRVMTGPRRVDARLRYGPRPPPLPSFSR